MSRPTPADSPLPASFLSANNSPNLAGKFSGFSTLIGATQSGTNKKDLGGRDQNHFAATTVGAAHHIVRPSAPEMVQSVLQVPTKSNLLKTLRLKSNAMYDISDPHPPKSCRLTTLPEIRFFFFFESATAWLHIVQSITIGHPGPRCSNLDALRGRQDFIHIHPCRRIFAGVARGAVAVVFVAIATFQQTFQR